MRCCPSLVTVTLPLAWSICMDTQEGCDAHIRISLQIHAHWKSRNHPQMSLEEVIIWPGLFSDSAGHHCILSARP